MIAFDFRKRKNMIFLTVLFLMADDSMPDPPEPVPPPTGGS
jgi:hypothetical protein